MSEIKVSEKSIFEKIIDREIPADIVYEDELSIAIKDINAQAPIHILIIPKKKISRVMNAVEDDSSVLGRLLYVSKLIAKDLGIDNINEGYRLVINNGKVGCETVPHLHIHMLSGRQMNWPPG